MSICDFFFLFYIKNVKNIMKEENESFCDCECDILKSRIAKLCQSEKRNLFTCTTSTINASVQCETDIDNAQTDIDVKKSKIQSDIFEIMQKNTILQDTINQCLQYNASLANSNLVLQEENDLLRTLSADLQIKVSSLPPCN